MSTSPRRIGQRYVLGRQIGRGGMGTVWLGVDDVLGREVALKRIGLFPGGASPGLTRAQREAKLAARLNHPHVVAVFDFVTEGDEQWLVMEHVPGTDLSALIKGGGLAPTDAAALLVQVVDALSTAHAAGIVHRDVKPSNILVSPDGNAKLTDFGIARARDSTITASGLVTGSPAYLAPEVASGSPATEASDVWSLGATLYHALTGHAPYDTTDSVLATMYRIVHEKPPRLPDVAWPAELLETTMATDPAGRWSMNRVREYLKSGPPRAQQPSATRAMPVPAQLTASAPTPRMLEESEADDRDARRAWTLPVLIATALLVLTAWVGYVLVSQQQRPSAGAASSGESSASPSQSPARSRSRSPSPTTTTPQQSSPPIETPSPSPTIVRTPTSGEPTGNDDDQAAAMRTFVQQYVATALTDPASSWEQLTPRFQQDCCESGMGGYAGYWNTIETASLLDIAADPLTLQVSYTITWDPEGELGPEDEVVTLGLVRQGGTYLIDYEL